MVGNDPNEFHHAVAEIYPLFYKTWGVQLERTGLNLRAILRSKGVR